MNYVALLLMALIGYAAGHSDQRNDNGFGAVVTVLTVLALLVITRFFEVR